MSDQKQKGVMSERLKEELARELGVADTVSSQGWGAVPARKCGMLVKLAIERAEKELVGTVGGGGAR